MLQDLSINGNSLPYLLSVRPLWRHATSTFTNPCPVAASMSAMNWWQYVCHAWHQGAGLVSEPLCVCCVAAVCYFVSSEDQLHNSNRVS